MTTALRLVTGDALREQLLGIVHRVLSQREGATPLSRTECATRSFASLGMDSLAGAELTVEIEEELGIELLPTDVFAYNDLDSLARFIENPSGPAVSQTEYSALTSPRSLALGRMMDDAILPPDIAPVGRSTNAAVLVTGATGFVGAHLVAAILRDTDAGVHCLIRDTDDDVARAESRLKSALELYELWNDAFAQRVDVVVADIERPSLGLDPGAFAKLAASVGHIYHAAADVDWIQPYDALRAANVTGTRELLRLACTGSAKTFHFVSSLGVCYNTGWSGPALETEDPLDALTGLHLGYAQSKCVAEALVREAGARGLPVTIFRPALVSGDSRSGGSNTDDLISRFIRGCIQMGAAPDLDWAMDSVPADFLARSMVALSARPSHSGGVYHIANSSPRHWRECVLWMRLRGYPIELLPYREWRERLKAAAASPHHPLHGLRSFFLTAVPDQGGLSLPELYEECRRRPASLASSDGTLHKAGLTCPRLDAHLLGRYFDSYIRKGVIDDVRSSRSTHDHHASRLRVFSLIERNLRERPDDKLTDITRHGGDDSIVAELTSWRRGTAAGLYRARLGASDEIIVKVKPRDSEVIAIGSQVAHLCGRALGAAYDRWQEYTGFTRGHLRELAINELAPDGARCFMPGLRATAADPESDQWVLAMERITDATVINASDRPWTAMEIETTLRGLAGIHHAWFANHDWLRAEWLPPARPVEVMAAMRPLWRALAENAGPMFDQWAGPELGAIQQDAIESVEQWRPWAEAQAQTLVHNDFNPRNILLRPKSDALELCAFDWELATVGCPQRDIAEFLCFALDPAVAQEEALKWIEIARLSCTDTSGVGVDQWRQGFVAALNELLIDRFAMYAMLHRVRPQPFLPRVTQTWLAIHRALEAS